MIEQHNNSSNNLHKQQLLLLCTNPHFNQHDFTAFLATLPDLDQPAQKEAHFRSLATAMVEILAAKPQETSTKLVALHILAYVLALVVDGEKSGYMGAAILLRDSTLQHEIRQILSKNEQSSEIATQLTQVFNKLLAQEFLTKLAKSFLSSMSSTSVQRGLSVIDLLISLSSYFQFIHPTPEREGNVELIKQIKQCCEALIEKKAIQFKKQEFDRLLLLCVDLQKLKQSETNEGYNLLWKLITKIFNQSKLDRKLLSLSCLDSLLSHLKDQSIANPIPVVKLTDFLSLIMDPQTHEQILNRSLNFLQFWLKNADHIPSLNSIFNKWFNGLIVNSDIRTSNIFANTWQKLVVMSQELGIMQVAAIYENAVNFYKKFYKKAGSPEMESQVIKVIGPLIIKIFKQFRIHEQNTLQFLKHIWVNQNNLSNGLKQLVQQSISQCMKAGISPKFNEFVLQETIKKLEETVVTNNLQQSEENLVKVEGQVTRIYSTIGCFMSSLLGVKECSSEGDELEKAKLQMKRRGLLVLQQEAFLSNLIICHNTQNREQLKQLLSLMTTLIEMVDNQQFQAKQLKVISRKVDNSEAEYLTWMRDRLGSIKNYQFKQNIMANMFNQPSLYKGICHAGLQVLLQVLLLYDCNPELKYLFAFSLLHQVKADEISHSTNLIIHSLWNTSQIVEDRWLFSVPNILNGVGFSDEQELTIYSEIIRIVQEISNCIDLGSDSDRVLGENGALAQTVQVKVKVIGHEVVEKVIKCSDNVPLWKFKILYIKPLLNQVGAKNLTIHQDVSAILYNSQQISHSDIHLSLRKLGSKFPSSELLESGSIKMTVEVKMGNKNYVLLNKIKSGPLFQTLHKYQGQNTLTIPANKICIKKQLKHLMKWLAATKNANKFGCEEIPKEEMFYIIQKAIEQLIKRKAAKNTQVLINELAQFLSEIDTHNSLTPNNQLPQCHHRKSFSSSQYFVNKSFNLLKKTVDNNVAKIPYEFLMMLINTEMLSVSILSEFETWIKAKAQQKPYLVCLAMDVQWLILKEKPQSSYSYVQHIRFNQIFKKVEQFVIFLNKSEQSSKTTPKQLQIYLKTIATGLKIFNHYFGLAIISHTHWVTYFFTREPKDLLSLMETQKNIAELSNPQNEIKFINSDPSTKEVFELALTKKFVPSIQVSSEVMIQTIKKIFKLVESTKAQEQSANLLTILYETSKLLGWITIISDEVVKDQIITFLISQLKSTHLSVSRICKSLLYICLRMNSKIYSAKILKGLFQNFHPNYSGFDDLFSQSYSNCEEEQLTSEINESLIQILLEAEPEKPGTKNQLLSGVLSILNKVQFNLNDNQNQTFLQIMTENYLFSANNQIKATHPSSRLAVYKSIETYLGKNSPQRNEDLYSKIMDQIKSANSQSEEVKDCRLGVGLQNLGHLCYMNSLLQLLHSIKPFVSQVCSIKSEFPLLVGLQNLLRSLTFSAKKAISPQQFVDCFDPPIDVGLQEDTTEFFISFLDKLEEGENGGNFKKIAETLFRGETVSQFKCQHCRTTRSITEPFYLYNLAIENENNNFANLQECLQNAEIPEIIHDVNCEKCHDQRKFTKKTKLKTVPKYFFIQLRRLIFDYQNPYFKAKVHSRLQFPDSLKIGGKQLLLKGVITHSGTGEHGHYYTSIRKEASQDWIVYNDSQVGLLANDGKESHWYGSNKKMGDYSTNAYVLLYSTQGGNNITEEMLPMTATSQILKQNQSLVTKQLLFGEQYKTDFINFAFNVARLPNIGDPLKKIYEMLALISYFQGQTTTIPPLQYFSSIRPNSTNIEPVLDTIFEYKEHNKRFLFHKNQELRAFFCFFLQKIFQQSQRLMREGKCKLALVYACELVNSCVGLIKDIQNFIYSAEYIKLVGFLIRLLGQREQFIKIFYEADLIQEIVKLFHARKTQIQMNFNSTQIKLVEPLLEMLISFLNLPNMQESSNFFKFSEYQQNAMLIRKFMLQEDALVDLIFMANSRQQYTKMFFQMLQLENEPEFALKLQNIARGYLKDSKSIGVNISRNFCHLLQYLQATFYSHASQKVNFCQAILGMVIPASLSSPLTSLKDRTYYYLNTRLEQGYLQILSQTLLQCLFEPLLNIGDLKILTDFLNLLLKLISLNLVYDEYFSNLCPPIALYSDYYTFLKDCLEEALKKIELGLVVGMEVSTLELKKTELRNNINGLRQRFQNRKIESEPVLCGSPAHKPEVIMEKLLNSLFVLVEDHENYWVGYSSSGCSLLLQYVDEARCLKEQFRNDEDLTKVLQAMQSETIDEQGQELQTTRRASEPVSMQEIISCVHKGWIRRKFVFTNITEDPIEYRITIIGPNIKNKQIPLLFNLEPGKSKELFIEKIKLNEYWGQMKLEVNGVEQIIGEPEPMQTMSMEGLSEHFMGPDTMM